MQAVNLGVGLAVLMAEKREQQLVDKKVESMAAMLVEKVVVRMAVCLVAEMESQLVEL